MTPEQKISKSAMQELIEWINKERLTSLGELTLSEITAKATELLKKEKEMIENAHDSGYNECIAVANGKVAFDMFGSTKYYSKTYTNQTLKQ